MSGRFLYFEDWTTTRNYQIDSVVEHSGELWWAEADPATGDEPGTDADWTKITGQSGSGGAGSSITSGTADPTGGAAGDAYVQVDVSDEIQSIWLNEAGTWAEYTIPAAGTSTDDQTAAEVDVTTTNFDGNLSATDDDVQAALETLDDLAVGGGGSGDITAVTTEANSGLAGGVTVGEAILTLDINKLPAVTSVTTGDHFLISDFTDSNANKKITADHFGTHLAGTGLDSTTTGQLELDLDTPILASTVEDTDYAVIADADDLFATKRVALATLGNHFSPSNALETADFPTPAAGNVYNVVDNFGQLYANIPETIGQSVTWTASGDGDDVSSLWGESNGTYRFRGITATSGVSSPQSGDVVLLPNGGFRHRGATRWAHLSNPLGWVGGPYADEDEADSHATALNDVSAYDDSLQLVTAFTAGTIHYQWYNVVPEVYQLTDAEVVDGTSDVAGTISGSQLDDFAPELGIAEATSKVSDEFGRISGRRVGEAIDAHVVPSTNETTAVADTSVIGTSSELSRDDHGHNLPTDQTLGFRPTGELFVEVTDVLESLHETVSYYSLDGTAGYDGGGYACQGEEYDLSPYQKTIHKVQIWVGAAEVSGGGYWRAGVFGTDSNGEIDAVYGRSAVKNLHGSNIFNFIFDDVVIPATEGRIAILGCRIDSDGESGSDSRSAHLREGDESDSSPDHSYDDAPDDFDRVHHSRYEHAFPEVGDGRHDHGESTVRGDIKIFYTITYDHGNLVGDGNVGVGHIDSGNADDGDVLTADGSGGAAFEAPTGGGGGGGTDDQTAAEVAVDTTNFSSNLTAADDTVQAALENY